MLNVARTARKKPVSPSHKIQTRQNTIKPNGIDSAETKDSSLVRSRDARVPSRRRSGSLFQPIEALQEPLPAAEHWIHSGKLQKRIVAQSVTWQERLVVLTCDAFFIGRPDTRRVGESISLLEITSVAKVRAEDALSSTTPTPNSRTKGSASVLQSLESWKSKPRLTRSSSNPKHNFVFEIKTSRDGHFNGRTYSMSCELEGDCDEWIQKIEAARIEAVEKEEAANRTSAIYDCWLQTQSFCYRVHHSRVMQFTMALLVALNFVVAVAEAERVPQHDTDEWWYFYHAEICFTVAFGIELLFNMIGHWFLPFWENRWSVFDFVIVMCSIIVIPLSDLPGFAILRLFRVFRVVRLFRLMKPLRVLIRALAASVVPVLNAFAILCIITCLYAVMGVQLFGEGTPDRFDKFSNAFFTMFQVCTGDGWAEAVARPMWDTHPGAKVSIFFVSYILIAGTFLLNIVVAVLLDEFISSVEKDKQTGLSEAMAEHQDSYFNPLDPLLSTLTQYISHEDLDKQIQEIFEVLDWQGKGAISFHELNDGLRRLPFDPPIVLTSDDFEEITLQHSLCDEGRVDAAAFCTIIRTQLRRFVQKFLNLKCMDGGQDNNWLILSLKQMLLNTHAAEERPPRAASSERQDRLEQLVLSLHNDMQQIKSALKIPPSPPPQPAPQPAPTPEPPAPNGASPPSKQSTEDADKKAPASPRWSAAAGRNAADAHVELPGPRQAGGCLSRAGSSQSAASYDSSTACGPVSLPRLPRNWSWGDMSLASASGTILDEEPVGEIAALAAARGDVDCKASLALRAVDEAESERNGLPSSVPLRDIDHGWPAPTPTPTPPAPAPAQRGEPAVHGGGLRELQVLGEPWGRAGGEEVLAEGAGGAMAGEPRARGGQGIGESAAGSGGENRGAATGGRAAVGGGESARGGGGGRGSSSGSIPPAAALAELAGFRGRAYGTEDGEGVRAGAAVGTAAHAVRGAEWGAAGRGAGDVPGFGGGGGMAGGVSGPGAPVALRLETKAGELLGSSSWAELRSSGQPDSEGRSHAELVLPSDRPRSGQA